MGDEWTKRNIYQATREVRDAHLDDLYRSGKTLQEAGDEHGITRERVRQILDERGIERRGGLSAATTQAAAVMGTAVEPGATRLLNTVSMSA
jgi:hypothetical protein